MPNTSLTHPYLASHTYKPRDFGWVLYPIGGVVTYIVANIIFMLLAIPDLSRVMDGGAPPKATLMLSMYSFFTYGAFIGIPALFIYVVNCFLMAQRSTYPSAGTIFWRPLGITLLLALVVALIGMIVPS